MDKKLILKALCHHDGHSLMPDWTWEKQMALTRALDELRVELQRSGLGDPGRPIPPSYNFV